MSNWKTEMLAIEAFLTLFDQQECCDVKFLVESTTIGAHKAFLQARSEVLGEWTKDWTPRQDPVVVNDLSEETFKAVLRYIYSDKVEVTNDNVFHFLLAAKIFKMAHLEAHCANHLSSSLNKENITAYIEQAVEFDASTFQAECRKVFAQHTKEILTQPEFLNVSQHALSSLLDSEVINVLEIDLFASVKKWMIQQCKKEELPEDGANMRRVLGDALYKIHFAAMTMLDFSNEVTTIAGLLNEAEMLQTYRKISLLKNDAVNCPFSANARCMNGVSQDSVQKQLFGYGLLNIAGTWCTIKNAVTNHNANGSFLNKTSLELVLQFCTDLMNSNVSVSDVAGDAETKANCLAKVQGWLNAASNPKDMIAVMSKLNEINEALADLP